MDLLLDEEYQFPAKPVSIRVTEYQPIRKWDVIFSGGSTPGLGVSMVAMAIPGAYDHILVYLGKDARGYAYAAEMRPDSLESGGDLRMFSLGQDYGENIHPSGAHIFSTNTQYEARRFAEPARQAILAKDQDLVRQVTKDLLGNFPYQFEYRHSGSILDRAVYLVDDGRAGGTGCADYWTTLLEEVAGLCFYQSRMSAVGIRDYFLYDHEGSQVRIPAELNPFGVDLYVRELFQLGFYLVEDQPHQYSCGGNPESGLVLPNLVYQSNLFEPGNPTLSPVRLATQ
ncbi:MAG: hypothetical protein Q8O37_04135 [Sulfuricellaceae bacterium]|nr:hypothetical protein [Sulfuricellaceae bacterium]